MAGYACGMNIKSHILVSPGQLENEILSREKTEKNRIRAFGVWNNINITKRALCAATLSQKLSKISAVLLKVHSTNADMKNSVYVLGHAKKILFKFFISYQ